MMEKEIVIEREMDKVEGIGQAYDKALKGDVHGLRRLYQHKPDALFDQITAYKDTVFHIAAYKGRKEALRVLLNMVPRPSRFEVLKMKNIHGKTVLHEVAAAGNVEAADALVRKLLSSTGAAAAVSINDEQENGNGEIILRKQILGDRNNLGETPLFRAAEFGKTEMVKYLVQQVEEVVGDLHDHYIRDDGVTILHSAVISQHFDTAIWLLNKDPKLATYKDNYGKTILHILARMPTAFRSTSHMNALKWFVYQCFPSHWDDDNEAAGQLSSSRLNDVECDDDLRKKHRQSTFFRRYINSKMNQTICKCLAKEWTTLDKIWRIKKTHVLAVRLAKMLVTRDSNSSWTWLVTPHSQPQLHQLHNYKGTICLEREYPEKEELELDDDDEVVEMRSNKLSVETPLLIAASTGIEEIVRLILREYPQAVECVNQNGQNILHLSILHRQFDIYNLVITEKKEATKRLVSEVDNHGCTILHLAANTKYYHGGIKPTPALQLQEELTWFKDVEKHIHPAYKLHRNKHNYTAGELFIEQHRVQLKLAQDWVKNTCQSSSTVAILVATVVFAAAYTAPGGFHENNGRPVLLDEEKPLYSFFTVMDIFGLASSLTSVVVFLSILTSSLELGDFARTIPRNMSIGFTSLFLSVTATMLTFTATIFLLVKLEKKWSTTLTYAAAFLPISIFALFQFPIYFLYFQAALKSIFDFIKKIVPGI